MSADTTLPATADTHKPFLGPLWLQVLIGAILGIIFGVVAPHAAAETAFLAQGFVKLIFFYTQFMNHIIFLLGC